MFHISINGYLGRNSRCKECRILLCYDYNKRSVNKRRETKIMRKYSLTFKKYNFLNNIKNCQICDIKLIGYTGGQAKVFDHNHKTNKFRGILCSACNLSIGHAKENINILNKMIKYLQRELENDKKLRK